MITATTLTEKDFETTQDVRWCPGCGDYAILKQVKRVLAESGIPKEKIVFISGIGCSSRFPYYIDTYGIHSIHGRAMTLATGLKTTRPDLSVWVITGDGDCLSIGGNHFIHTLRRNPNLNILLFNNKIYGLTKGQYSPTSEESKITKSSPQGSIGHPLNTPLLALAAHTSFVARSIDTEIKHAQDTLHQANQHKGTSLVEIYQNCNIFNDGAFDVYKSKETRLANNLYLEADKPLLFGKDREWGICLDGLRARVVAAATYSASDLWIHNPQDYQKALLLAQFTDMSTTSNPLPLPLGVLYAKERPTHEDEVLSQLEDEKKKKGVGNINQLIEGNQSWVVA